MPFILVIDAGEFAATEILPYAFLAEDVVAEVAADQVSAFGAPPTEFVDSVLVLSELSTGVELEAFLESKRRRFRQFKHAVFKMRLQKDRRRSAYLAKNNIQYGMLHDCSLFIVINLACATCARHDLA